MMSGGRKVEQGGDGVRTSSLVQNVCAVGPTHLTSTCTLCPPAFSIHVMNAPRPFPFVPHLRALAWERGYCNIECVMQGAL